ncbi:hypothetical protein POTOM_059491 [Populus tomentosa]|uniref:Uncharacterized protein n=1 Tax=Populus tomentosa TaxID=118781 RepID=A0A8X8BZY6_POPTO|nr:hypothetical protein POTOM_059491 [Populus tomentosa]
MTRPFPYHFQKEMLCIKTMEWDINVKLLLSSFEAQAITGQVASTSRAMILLLVVLFSAIFLTSEARILKGGQALQGNANNSRHLLLDLGFDRSKLEHYRRLSTLGVPPDRVTPAGPDPHHH